MVPVNDDDGALPLTAIFDRYKKLFDDRLSAFDLGQVLVISFRS